MEIHLGDEVAVRNITKNKLDSNYNPGWYRVIAKNNSELTLERDGKVIKRNENQVVRRPASEPNFNPNFSPHSLSSQPIHPPEKEREIGDESSSQPKVPSINPSESNPQNLETGVMEEPVAEPRPKRIRRPNPRYLDQVENVDAEHQNPVL